MAELGTKNGELQSKCEELDRIVNMGKQLESSHTQLQASYDDLVKAYTQLRGNYGDLQNAN